VSATRENASQYSVVSLFCGLGGLDLGFEWGGFEVLWANDLVPHATETYRLNFSPDVETVTGDVTQVPLGEIPSADVVIGGPPCQSFSLVGQRRPDDPRGALVFRFFEVVEAKRPQAFVMENVPGMAASRINGQRLPEVLADAFAGLGYEVSLFRLLATDYLVPQLRRRLVLVGRLGGPRPEEPDGALFVRECYGIDPNEQDLGARAAVGDLGACVARGERSPYREDIGAATPFARIMRRRGLPDVSLHEEPRMSDTDRLLVEHIPPGGNYADIPDEIAPGRVLKFKRTGGRTTTYGRLHPDRPSYTINTYFRRPNVGCNFHYSEPRLITPREAMRFQSIPDHFELRYGSQDGRNALIGNAVPPLMAHAIAWTLKQALEGKVRQNSPRQSYRDPGYIQPTLL
jgi:DNA (cytosine-5)-methyltransferase 1